LSDAGKLYDYLTENIIVNGWFYIVSRR
jgi:hypothetical protein